MKYVQTFNLWWSSFSPWLLRLVQLLVVLVVVGIIGYIVIGRLLRLINRRRLRHQEAVFLELTPPTINNHSVTANNSLIGVVHELGANIPWTKKLLAQRISLSLELVSSRDQGIRYIVRVPSRYASVIEQQLNAHTSNLLIRRVNDPWEGVFDGQLPLIVSFKQTGHWAFPISVQQSLAQHDPIAYIGSGLTKLAAGEFMAWQLVVTPTKLRQANDIAAKILRNENLLASLSRRRNSSWSGVFRVINKLLFVIIDTITEVTHGSSGSSSSVRLAQHQSYNQLKVAKQQIPARVLSNFEREVVESVKNKVAQPLFYVSARAIVLTSNQSQAMARIEAIKASLASYTVLQHQSLKARYSLPLKRLSKLRLETFQHRLPAFSKRREMILGAAEVAALYHFPYGQAGETENLITSFSRTLPAPVAIKRGADNGSFDVALGLNRHHGSDTPIGLTAAERQRHLYIVGGTGNGKTTMLQYAIVQDMLAGKGLAVIDPHGDMALTLLSHVPPERLDDVIYFNPDDSDYPFSLNLLELTPGLSGRALQREKDLICESVISIFSKVFEEDGGGGHRIEYILRNAIHTALCVEGATLFTVLKLLQNKPYRLRLIKHLEDQDIKDFWNNEFGQAGNMQRVKMSAGVTAKLGRFNSNVPAKLVLGQSRSTLNFEEIIDQGKILICNFSKGLLGEDVAELFGITVMAKLQLASLRRARLAPEARRPFYLYVDEFQNFATATFEQLLSEARKYKLFITMAEQSTSQQRDQRLVQVILANVGTLICFRTGNPLDEQLLLPKFSPYLKKGEIADLDSFSFYARLSAMQAQEPLSGQTVLLNSSGNPTIAKQAIALSRKKYACDLTGLDRSHSKTLASNQESASRQSMMPENRLGGMV